MHDNTVIMLINFEKPQIFWKTQKPKFQNMKCMKNKRLETYKEKENLEKAWKITKEDVWSERERECLGDEQVWTERERSKKWESDHEESIYRPSVKLDRCKCRGSYWGSYRGNGRRQLRYRGTTHQIQEQKLDRSTRCWEAIEEAGAFSIDPPGIEELSRKR